MAEKTFCDMMARAHGGYTKTSARKGQHMASASGDTPSRATTATMGAAALGLGLHTRINVMRQINAMILEKRVAPKHTYHLYITICIVYCILYIGILYSYTTYWQRRHFCHMMARVHGGHMAGTRKQVHMRGSTWRVHLAARHFAPQ